jgi:hypothetical protein
VLNNPVLAKEYLQRVLPEFVGDKIGNQTSADNVGKTYNKIKSQIKEKYKNNSNRLKKIYNISNDNK